MTETPSDDMSARQRRGLVAIATARTIATIAVVVVVYFLLPMDRGVNAATVAGLVLGVLVLAGITALQIRRIIGSKHPIMRAVEALAFTIPLYILLFATAYFLMAHAQAASFAGPLSRTDAMYFSTTVFTTVGFGDIAAKTEAARIVVTIQMILDLVIIGLVGRLVINAIKIGQRRQNPTGLGDAGS